MAKGKGRKRTRYFRTLQEVHHANPQTLAKYIRERFSQEAVSAEGRESLRERVLKLHEVERRPQAGSIRPAQAGSIADVAGAFAAGVMEKLGVSARKPDPVPELDACERWEGTTRVTGEGDFPEAAQYPVLLHYRRERDSNDLVYFRRLSDSRRLMLGKTVELFEQEHYQGAVPAGVNGLMIYVPRAKRVGVPLPHFNNLRQSFEAYPIYGPEHDMPVGRQTTPPPPPPPRLGKRQTYAMAVYGDCLCDPVTLDVVVELTHVVSTMESIPPEKMELSHAAL
jgi:hypothetical protein